MRLASIHGRFQPFHNGHLSYALSALDRCEFVYVGVTRLRAMSADDSGSDLRKGLHSGEDNSNPFSFFQRRQLVEAGLTSAGVSRERFAIIPFPIEEPATLSSFFPRDSICFTTIKDDWNIKKITILEENGFKVEVLENVERFGYFSASGSQIREWARSGDERWRLAVPAGVAELLQSWDGRPVDVDRVL